MIKRVALIALCFSLGASAGAQKKTPVKPAAVKKQPPAKRAEEIPPPEVEALEDTKIDVVPMPEVTFDSTLAPDDDLTREIKKMLAITNAINIGFQASERILAQQRKTNTNKEMDVFYDRFMHTFKSQRGRRLFENIFVKIYRESYTLDEVRQMMAFYDTPLGKKTLQVTPLILEKTQSQCRQLGEMLGMEAYRQIQEEQEKN